MNGVMQKMAMRLGGKGFVRQSLNSHGDLSRPVEPYVTQCVANTVYGKGKRVYGKETSEVPSTPVLGSAQDLELMGRPKRAFVYVQLVPNERDYFGEPTPAGVKIVLHKIFPENKYGTTRFGCLDKDGKPSKYDHYVSEILAELFN